MRPRLPLALLFLICLTPLAHAQPRESALSDGEVEQIREAAYYPSDRVLLFIKFMDERTRRIDDLYKHPRKPGREEDTHDLMEQFTSIADELDDNLDDYGPRHRDIRKALPKLLDATERWSSNLKTPPDDDAYNVSRRIALEAVQDLKEAATQMLDEQKAWFLAHPPPKDDGTGPPHQ